MRFAHQPSTLQLGRQIPMRHGLIAQQPPGVIDEKSRRIQHHQHLGDQRLHQRLAHFVRNRRRNLGFSCVHLSLKLPQHSNPPTQPQLSPSCLRRMSPRYGSLNIVVLHALKFAQNFARSRIHRHNLPRRDLQISSH